MSAIFTRGIRHEFITLNPISKVRCSAMRLKDPDVLKPLEFRNLLPHLPLRECVMVMLVGSTGLRRSEMFALKWSNLCMVTMQVHITRAVVNNHFGKVKTPGSRKPVPIHQSVLATLQERRALSVYRDDEDFIFPSIRRNGKQPVSPDMVLRRIIRPALKEAAIVGETTGWHRFRHSLATNLRAMGVDEGGSRTLRHANRSDNHGYPRKLSRLIDELLAVGKSIRF